MSNVELFTDGACRVNPGPGGWGVLIRYNEHEKQIYGSERYTTNNRMELMAAIEGLRTLRKPCHVIITTDSQYVHDGITKWLPKWQKSGWRNSQKKSVKNADLWQALVNETKRHQITWQWVRGHSGHPENAIADQLANKAIDECVK